MDGNIWSTAASLEFGSKLQGQGLHFVACFKTLGNKEMLVSRRV